jgi:hypothetical protein
MHEKSWCRYYISKLKECANSNNVVDLDFTPFVKDMRRYYNKYSAVAIDLDDCFGSNRSFYPFPPSTWKLFWSTNPVQCMYANYINITGYDSVRKTNNQLIFVNDTNANINVNMKYPLMLKKRLTYCKHGSIKFICVKNIDYYAKSVYDRLDEVKPTHDESELDSGLYM